MNSLSNFLETGVKISNLFAKRYDISLMHLQRWITSLIGLPFLILLIMKGGPLLFGTFAVFLCLVAMREYFHMVFAASGRSLFDIVPVLGYITGIAIVFAAYHHSFQGMLGVIMANILICGFITTFRFYADPLIMEALFKQFMGITYIPLLISCLILIRNGPEGIFWILFLLLMVAANDTGAYYAGSWFGKHKLCPNVSPGKTIEGFLGGLAALMLFGILFKACIFPAYSWGLMLLLFILVGIIAPTGDLFESVLKRTFHVKDSGNLLAGHGGILDRIDALMFAAPVVYLFKEFLIL
jgi:phosphatidate cytidylyltransferase